MSLIKIVIFAINVTVNFYNNLSVQHFLNNNRKTQSFNFDVCSIWRIRGVLENCSIVYCYYKSYGRLYNISQVYGVVCRCIRKIVIQLQVEMGTKKTKYCTTYLNEVILRNSKFSNLISTKIDFEKMSVVHSVLKF